MYLKNSIAAFFAITISTLTYAQPKLKTIISESYKEPENAGDKVRKDTLIYKFKDGKLDQHIDKSPYSGRQKSYYYNTKGLLETIIEKYNGTGGVSYRYEYDDKGIIKTKYQFELKPGFDPLNISENDKATPISVSEITSVISGADFDIKIVVKSMSRGTLTPSGEINYVRKGNTITYSSKSFGIQTQFVFTYQNGNRILEDKVKSAKEAYTIEFSYDNEPNVYNTFLKRMLGDQYFINAFIVGTLVDHNYAWVISENNFTSRKLTKTKGIIISDNESKIEYNGNHYPEKITTKIGFENYLVSKFTYE